ncbi:hypothetical protein [Candidatus Odyssella acanthamoebae]|uniref:Uncharacterized protein n=1 Tax=Candidatus Odyssella acanthamoebae TaxID=91604 RepID=A0A077AQQ2_9PROT|nr:hypothetical protein [Candidatus Paracaedibacter acanthamoebae]AIK95502.1 hypothetical protein ID47_00115 [Candidatus Paracaedibacter acanthamoebae]
MKDKDIFKEFDFVMSAKYAGAITFEDLKEWIYFKLKINDYELPTFMFEILEAEKFYDIPTELTRLILNHCQGEFTQTEHRALYGIAYKRGFYSKENPCELCTEKTALKNLEKNPHILERFKQTFPFIKLERTE